MQAHHLARVGARDQRDACLGELATTSALLAQQAHRAACLRQPCPYGASEVELLQLILTSLDALAHDCQRLNELASRAM